MYLCLFLICFEGHEFISILYCQVLPQGPEEICLSLEHQSPSKTSDKMGYFDRVTVSLQIL